MSTLTTHYCNVCEKKTKWISIGESPDGWVTRRCNVCKQIAHVSPERLKKEKGE